MTDPDLTDPRPLPVTHPIAVRSLAAEGETPFDVRPDAAARARLVRHLGVASLDDVALSGSLRPHGRKGWRLEARLRARVVQACIVTLAPVASVIDQPVVRTYLPGAAPSVALDLGVDAEAEDPPEPLGEAIELGAILVEELALAIEPYPRAPGAELGTLVSTPPGAAPLDPEAEKPFAGLARLRGRLGGDSD